MLPPPKLWALGDVDFGGSGRTKLTGLKTCFLPRLVAGGDRKVAPRPQPAPGRTYQQLRLKTLSRREKLCFMVGVLRSKGGEADRAHRLPALSRAAPTQERELVWGEGWGGRLLRYWDNRPSSHPERRSPASAGLAARGRPQSRKESRVDRSRFLEPSVGSPYRGLQVPGLALARLHQQQAQS